jgi:hypothetical protein
MKKTQLQFLLILTSFTILLLQCKKDKDKNNGVNLTKGLLALFKMNDNFDDSTGNIPIASYSVSGINAVADRNGNTKNAMLFDGGKLTALVKEWPANPITISCWVLPKYYTNDNFFLWSANAAFGFYQKKDSICFAISVPATNSAMVSLDTGWVHLTGTYDGKQIRTFINGKLMGTRDHPGEPETTSKLAWGSVTTPYWKGTLDEIRFYNRVLSDEEIAVLATL